MAINTPTIIPVSATGATAINTDLFTSQDFSNYQSVSIAITWTWVWTLTFQGSKDWVTFFTIPAVSIAWAVVTTTAANGIFTIFPQTRFYRVRMTAYTSGTAFCTADANFEASPIALTTSTVTSGTTTATQGAAAAISATTGLGGWYVHPAIVGIVDIASAALTTTTTTASLANALWNAFQITIPVTAVTGTTPTLDVRIEESFDWGTNWVTLYEFQRITATWSYNSPNLRATGRNIRYVQTISGTTPSFTRSVTRNILPFLPASPQKRLFDRVINVNTLNTTSTMLFSGEANAAQLIINMGAITTTAPQFKIQGSEDNSVWYDLTTPITAIASSVVMQDIKISPTYVRAITSTAWVGATLNYLSLKAYS